MRFRRRKNMIDQPQRPPVNRSTLKGAKVIAVDLSLLFERVLEPLFLSEFLLWHEAERLGEVSKICHQTWMEEHQESYKGWQCLLQTLDARNGTNRCSICFQMIPHTYYRMLHSKSEWTIICGNREPQVEEQSIVDWIISSGFISLHDETKCRHISKTWSRVRKRGLCLCPRTIEQARIVGPYVPHDPRYWLDWNTWSAYRKSQELARYTTWMVSKSAILLSI